MSFIKRKRHHMPQLNTAALPDLIFTVLFFFMIVTHMRNVTPQVNVQAPQGKELSQFKGGQNIVYIYIGMNQHHEYVVQLNNQLVDTTQLSSQLSTWMEHQPPTGVEGCTAFLQADRQAPMQMVMAVKKALVKAGVKRISYSATETEAHHNIKTAQDVP